MALLGLPSPCIALQMRRRGATAAEAPLVGWGQSRLDPNRCRVLDLKLPGRALQRSVGAGNACFPRQRDSQQSRRCLFLGCCLDGCAADVQQSENEAASQARGERRAQSIVWRRCRSQRSKTRVPARQRQSLLLVQAPPDVDVPHGEAVGVYRVGQHTHHPGDDHDHLNWAIRGYFGRSCQGGNATSVSAVPSRCCYLRVETAD